MGVSGDSHGVEMGGLQLSSNVIEDNESASLFGPSPLSVSSPSRLLPANAERRPTTRRHVIRRLICSPFTALLRTTSARASACDHQASNVKAGEARRPSLEELLRMESSSNPELKAEPGMAPYDSWKESAIVVFDFAENDMSRAEEAVAPLAISKDQNVVPDDEQRTAILPVEFDVGQSAALGGGDVLSLTLRMNVNRFLLILAALRERSRRHVGRSKGSYWRLAGRRATDKAELLFYHRPIPLGRRCRVQHLEESPYM